MGYDAFSPMQHACGEHDPSASMTCNGCLPPGLQPRTLFGDSAADQSSPTRGRFDVTLKKRSRKQALNIALADQHGLVCVSEVHNPDLSAYGIRVGLALVAVNGVNVVRDLDSALRLLKRSAGDIRLTLAPLEHFARP